MINSVENRTRNGVIRTHLSSAAYEGRIAAEQGWSINMCPYVGEKQIPLAAEWRNAWAAERDRIRGQIHDGHTREHAAAMAKYNRENRRAGGDVQMRSFVEDESLMKWRKEPPNV